MKKIVTSTLTHPFILAKHCQARQYRPQYPMRCGKYTLIEIASQAWLAETLSRIPAYKINRIDNQSP